MSRPGKVSGRKLLFSKLDEAASQFRRSLRICFYITVAATFYALYQKGLDFAAIKQSIRSMLALEEHKYYPVSWPELKNVILTVTIPVFFISYGLIALISYLLNRKQDKLSYRHDYKAVSVKEYHEDLKEWVFAIEKKLKDFFVEKRSFWEWFHIGYAAATGGETFRKAYFGKYISIGKEKAVLTEKQLNLMTSVLGVPQTGKSSLFEDIVPQLRERGYSAIVLDYNGENYAKYAQEDDIMWCPFDKRTTKYSLFGETGVVPEQMTLALIEDQLKGDKFWRGAASRVLADFMRLTDDHRDLSRLIASSREDQFKMLKNAGMASAQYLEEARIASSVKSTLERDTQLIPLLDHNGAHGTPFSVYNWAKKGYRNWLFVLVPRSYREFMRPWLRLFTELAIIGGFEREMYGSTVPTMFIGDEWPQIGYVPSFKELLSNGPKYGMSGIFGWHTDEQIVSVYGEEAKEILTTIRTRAIFNPGDHKDSVQRAADLLGEEEISKLYYSISTTNQGSPTITAHVDEKKKHIVQPNEISRLQEFEFYLKTAYMRPIKLTGFKDPDYQPKRANLDISLPQGFAL